MGYVRGVIHGAVLGTVAGLCIAPQEGARTRDQLRQLSGQARRGYQRAQETAQRFAPAASQAVERVAELVGQARGSVGRDNGSADPYGLDREVYAGSDQVGRTMPGAGR